MATALSLPFATRQAPFADALLRLGQAREDVVVLSADLAKYTDVQPFADRFPDRFFQIGMAEQNMIGIAGGLAKSGFLPIAVTYGVFASRRAYDQVAMSLLTGPSRGIIVAFLPGITTPFRATHQAIEDLALMRALPGMTVVDPADATELEAAVLAAAAHTSSVYIRGQRGQVVELFDPHGFAFEIGATRVILDRGEFGLVSTGIATLWALEATSVLEQRGRAPSLLHVPTLKPVDESALLSFCGRFAVVTTVENHTTIGGLASLVSEVLCRHGSATRVQAVGVPDCWADAGTLPYIRARLGLDAESIADTAEAAA